MEMMVRLCSTIQSIMATIPQVIYHILLDIGLACGCLLGDASGGEATLKPVLGLTIGIAFRTRVVTGGEC